MSESITLDADGESFQAYVARPDGAPIGGLVLIHEIWGLVDHIRDVADRYAREGWLVAAPDILSHAGVGPALGAELFALMNSPDEKTRTAAQPRLRDALTGMRAPAYAAWAVQALGATVDWLDGQGVAGRVTVSGFCFGGTFAFLLAAADDRVRAVAPFYGSAPDAARLRDIHAPVLALYGELDPPLMAALPAVRAQLAEAGIPFETIVYPGAAHAFFNDTGSRYDPVSAADAWDRVRAFLAAHV